MYQKNNYPDWVLKQRVKGTAIYKRGNNFYLYKVTSKYNPETKKAKRITEKFLGTITPSGIIPPKHELTQQAVQNTIDCIVVKEYGSCCLLNYLNSSIHENLKSIFSDRFEMIIVLSMLRLIHACPFKNIQLLYESSYLSIQYPGLDFSDKHIIKFIRTLGENRSKIISFFKQFDLGEQNILFDLTSILTQSKDLDINTIGYKHGYTSKKQINLMYSFNVSKHRPAYYRILPGNIREIKAFKLSIQELGLENAMIIADKGFYSDANINALNEEGLQYLVPLKRNSRLIIKKYIDKLNEEFFLFNDKPIWYHSYIHKDHRIILFLNERLSSEEREDYLIRVANQHIGYTLDSFHNKSLYFGIFALVTNITSSITPENAYIAYKSRIHIEQLFDVYKNILHIDSSYMRGADEMEAWMFINHIASMYYYSLYNILNQHKLLNKYSPKDILLHFNNIKQLKINQKWIRSEVTSKTEKLIQQMKLADIFSGV